MTERLTGCLYCDGTDPKCPCCSGRGQQPRGKNYVEPRGYAARPGTGPKDETCGSCLHKVKRYDRFYKCLEAKGKWTGGRGSDILLKSPACSLWEAESE